jgi:DNA-binding HxlR family transcriptional regulator
MLGRSYEDQACSLANALGVIGERWTLLVIRDALFGLRRFDEFAESLGVARNVLSSRLQRLVEGGILVRVRYQERPERFEYRLTPQGLDLATAVVALMRWGDQHLGRPDGSGRLVEHRACGTELVAHLACPACDRLVRADEVITRLAQTPAGVRTQSNLEVAVNVPDA